MFLKKSLDARVIYAVIHRSLSAPKKSKQYQRYSLIWSQVMYENKCRLMCTAEGTPLELFDRIVTISDAQQMSPRTSSRSRKNDDSELCVDNELGFAKDRTVSRYVPLFNP